ncbi:helix-turn-helix domain-containing protein [Conexibacter woesei]|uniref:helix-turn-helix domain-containing protein n=1 Tax=Conexibacter woesei TaxID=191495 RepID=UPI001E3DAB21|nr:helix-turn-helix transcriptional regulator [Conexibacter woesei]
MGASNRSESNGNASTPPLSVRGQNCTRYSSSARTNLADRSGVHWTFVGQLERGRRNVSLHNLLKVAAGLGVDPGELVAGLKPPN